jgi:hypothetical protein
LVGQLPEKVKIEKALNTFTIPKAFHEHSGLHAQSSGDIVLFCRDAFHRQFLFIKDRVIKAGKFGWILGTPGTGKSSTAFAFLTTLDRDEWVITWLQLDKYGNCQGLRFNGMTKSTVHFPCITKPEDLEKYLAAECGDKMHIVIIDGLYGSGDIFYLSFCTLWFKSDMTMRRLVFISSTATRVQGNLDEEKKYQTEEHRVHSWELFEFQSAADEEVFFRTIEQNLDSGINLLTNAGVARTVTRAEMIVSKFHFSGGSCRYMFGYPTAEVLRNIDDSLAFAGDIAQYIEGTLGNRSRSVVNRLIGSSHNQQSKTTTYSILSDFAAGEIATKMGPALIRVLASAVSSSGNPTFTGGFFEMEFFAALSHTGVCLQCKDGTNFHWTKSNYSKLDPGNAGTVSFHPTERVWLKPLKWNLGGYDAVFIDVQAKFVQFVQVTTAHKHTFKIEYFWQFMDQLKHSHQTDKINIVFLVPLAQLNSFSITSVTGEGLLGLFQTPLGQVWVKSKEKELVQIVASCPA